MGALLLTRAAGRLAGLLAALCVCATPRAQPMTFVMDPFPPFTYEEKGVPAGPMSEIILAACKAMRVECRLQSYPWRRALRMAEDGEVDGIYALARIPEREASFYLMPPVIVSGYGIFVHRSSKLAYTQPSDLAGYSVAAYGPSAATVALQAIAASAPTIMALTEIDNLTLLRMLSSQRYGDRGAALANVDVGNYLIRAHDIPDVKLVGRVGRIEYCVGLSRKKVSEQQAARFAAALSELIRTGQVRKIGQKYGVVTPGG